MGVRLLQFPGSTEVPEDQMLVYFQQIFSQERNGMIRFAIRIRLDRFARTCY
jgi:hypothetical protein